MTSELLLLAVDVANLCGSVCGAVFFSKTKGQPFTAFRIFFVLCCCAFITVLVGDAIRVLDVQNPLTMTGVSLLARGCFGIGIWILIFTILRMRRPKNGGDNGR